MYEALEPNISSPSYTGVLYVIDSLLFEERQFLKIQAIYFHR